MKKISRIKSVLGILGFIISLLIINHSNIHFISSQSNENNEDMFKVRSAGGDWDPQITKTVGSQSQAVYVGDANNDGYNDIVICRNSYDALTILIWNESLNDWNTNFDITVENPQDVVIDDVNNDGFNDIVNTYGGNNTISVQLWNNTIGTWDPHLIKLTGAISLWRLDVEDANNDGFNDICITDVSLDHVHFLIWNDTIKDWNSDFSIYVGDAPQGISIKDANDDGYKDIITSNFFSDDISILLWNDSIKYWESPIRKYCGDGPRGVFVGDANNDGYNDILSSNGGDRNIAVFLWNSTSIQWNDRMVLSPGLSYPYRVVVADANNDGYNDIVTPNWQSVNDISILLWNETAKYWDAPIRKPVGVAPNGVFVADANNDGYNDIVACNMASTFVSIYLWNTSPQIRINRPFDDELYGKEPPEFNVEISDDDGVDSMWYILGNLSTKIFFLDNGTIEPSAWSLQLNGTIIIQFYANDSNGAIGFSEVRVRKDINPPTVQVNYPNQNELFGTIAPNFNIEVNDENGVDSMWYTLDGGITNTTFSNNESIDQELWNSFGNGTITINFYVNDTVGNIGFVEIPVRKVCLLFVEIINHFYTEFEFSIEFMIFDSFGRPIDFAVVEICWDGDAVSSEDITNKGEGIYNVTLTPILVLSYDTQILLNMSISALGYEDKYFETLIAVDPDILKVDNSPITPIAVIIINALLISGIIALVTIISVFYFKKRKANQ